MTATEDTPSQGHESTVPEVDRESLRSRSDSEIAELLEATEFVTWPATARVRSALTGSRPLTGEDVETVAEVGENLEAIAEVLASRVPEEHRVESRRE